MIQMNQMNQMNQMSHTARMMTGLAWLRRLGWLAGAIQPAGDGWLGLAWVVGLAGWSNLARHSCDSFDSFDSFDLFDSFDSFD